PLKGGDKRKIKFKSIAINGGGTFLDALKAFGIMVGSGGGEQKLSCPQCQGERKKHTHDRPLAVNV
ncbi:MAG TPA: hypothetical protein DCS88_04270, partial [Alphaproteobacteria bacterium]|nr:hypothetical protein [Alphaproteobacteria bacterium]